MESSETMATKRAADTEVVTTVTETKEDNEPYIPPLKLRIKETVVSSGHYLVADISNSLRQSDKRLCASLKLSGVPISSLSVEDGEQLIKVLKESLKKEDQHIVRERILLNLRDLLKIPNLNKLINIDELIEPAQKEGKIMSQFN